METIDKIIFGDNQFFGINHMSQEKAQQMAEQFHDTNSIFNVYNQAIDAGINSIMLNSNDRAKEICAYFKKNKNRYEHIHWYPSIPYPYKYANLIAEKGIFPAVNEILFSGNTAGGVLNMIVKGGTAVIKKDAIKMMKMLIDTEMRIFKGLDIKVVFLQNIITDLMLGYGVKEVFEEYCDHIRKEYKAIPGFITQNLPYLKIKCKEWGIKEIALCSSINKIGYLMSPNREAYENVLKENNASEYQILAMSTLASGAIPAKEAYEYINQLKIQSIVFGASSEKHIRETVNLIKI